MKDILDNRHLVIVISGPSGSGKSTIIHRVLGAKRLPSPIRFSISATTRRPRPGEKDGKDYHFLTEKKFRKEIEAEAFLEWAEVHDNLYGTPRSEVDRAKAAGADLLLEIDVQGAMNVKAAYPDAVMIFLYVTEENLRARLHGRQSGLTPEELEELIELRMKNMRRELEYMRKYDYVVVNEDLDTTVDYVVSIVKAEKRRVNPR